jgi:DNA-binding transcriptional ArsR family regulator
MGGVLDAATLVGLLAEPARRRVIAALILEADTRAGLVARTGLSTRRVAQALGRLQAAGLVVEGDDGTLVVMEQSFPVAAALRRYLVDEGLMDRDAGKYWRCGGTVDPD